MNRFNQCAILLVALCLTACVKEQEQPITSQVQDQPQQLTFPTMGEYDVQIPDVPAYTGPIYNDDQQTAEPRGQTIVVYPGTNQLQDIFNEASWDDKILLMPGTHHEDETLVINRRLWVQGQNGAVLSLGGVLGLYVYGAHKTLIQNVEIVNAGTSVFGVAAEDTDQFKMKDNHLSGFTATILLDQTWKAKIVDNTVVGVSNIPDGPNFGITLLNGDKSDISGNDVSSNVFGIWACDEDGKAFDNVLHGNLIGLILCKVPAGNFSAIFSGGTGGSENPATNWNVRQNDSHYNIWGYLVVDGANNNRLKHNEAHDNAFVDLELAGETNLLFGFTTPTSHDNEVDAGTMYYIECGVDNEVVNGIEAGVPCSL